eukprot:342271-Hanusia_phi.AAC.1
MEGHAQVPLIVWMVVSSIAGLAMLVALVFIAYRKLRVRGAGAGQSNEGAGGASAVLLPARHLVAGVNKDLRFHSITSTNAEDFSGVNVEDDSVAEGREGEGEEEEAEEAARRSKGSKAQIHTHGEERRVREREEVRSSEPSEIERVSSEDEKD